MDVSTNIVNINNDQMSGDTLQKVIINNDLSNLSPIEKVQYIKHVCNSLSLNPLTKPIQLIKFQGREIMYFAKDATEQLRKINNVSVDRLESKLINDSIYIVTAYASIDGKRTDSATGVISILGMKGEMLSNAMMKAETKAKRRVTLSICGLGHMDECEVKSLIGSQNININYQDNDNVNNINEDIKLINECKTYEELKIVFTDKYKHWVNIREIENIKILIDAKDKKKVELDEQLFNEDIKDNNGEMH